MATCYKCGDEYPDKRLSIGYHTCLSCGDKEASTEANRRRKCVAPAFNKGAYMYVSDTRDAFYAGKK
jgi:hypothetical protein